MFTMPHVDRLTLEKIQIGTHLTLSPSFLLDAQVSVEQTIGKMIEVQVRGFLWGRQARHYEFRTPVDWWQAVRQRFAPAWWLRRHPVRERVEVVDAKAIWPEFRYLVPGQRCEISLIRQEALTHAQD